MTSFCSLGLLIAILAGGARWPSGAAVSVWIDPHNAPSSGIALVERAMKTWTNAADGRLRLEKAATRDAASIRVYFVRSESNYGETLPRVDGRTGAIVSADVAINADVVAAAGDSLQQRIVAYLTALHELGHALGLPHTNDFDTIMYSFRRPDDGARYFAVYRRRVRSDADIGSAAATGLAPADVITLRALYDPPKP